MSNLFKKVFVLKIIMLLCGFTLTAQKTLADSLPTIAQPIFLKMGFSSVIEFDKEPEKVVLGDSQSFQVEKLGKSLVLRSLAPYTSSNLFVYFKNYDTQIFSLTASEDAQPTLLKKILVNGQKIVLPPSSSTAKPADMNIITTKTEVKSSVDTKKSNTVKKSSKKELVKIIKSEFSKNKDYLTLDFKISAGSERLLKPKWDLTRLNCDNQKIAPYKVWSERKEIQKDSEIKARLTYLRPNIKASLKNCKVLLPLYNTSDVLSFGVSK